MILRGRQRLDQPIAEFVPSRFPALFDRVEFWRVGWQVGELDCLFVSSEILSDGLSFVRADVVDEEKASPPSSSELF